MFEERFERLTMADQENFKRIINRLLAHTYVIQDMYDGEEHMKRSNPEYIFIDRNFEIFEEYLSYAGFRLQKDSNYGVISISSSFDFNRQKFDKLTTLMLYVIRLMYEEHREEVSLSEVILTTGEILQKMVSLGVVKKRPAMRDIRDALRSLIRFRILEKLEGSLEDAQAKYIVLPTILFIVPNERISTIFRELEEADTNGSEDNDTDLDAAEEADTGFIDEDYEGTENP